MAPKVVSVVGNIGAGKSTLLAELCKSYPHIEEGVDEWVSDHGFNWLEAFYREPARWTLPFQMRILQTLDQTGAAIKQLNAPIVLTERSPLDSRHVFFEYHRAQGWVNAAEYQLYDYHWRKVAWRPGAIVFVKTDADKCHQRAIERGRAGENSLEPEFLRAMHKHYERFTSHCADLPVLVVDNNDDGGVAEKVARVRQFIDAL